MDEAYGWSAFGNSVMTNKPSDFGIIFGTDGEPDLNPLAKFNYEFLELLQYDYGLVELMKWINKHSDYHERIHVMTAACMAWNLACKYVNDESDE